MPLPSAVVAAKNWPHTAKKSDFKKWYDAKLVASNALQVSVQTKSWDRLQTWNPLTDELRPLINTYVSNVVDKISLNAEEAKLAKDHVSWDIMMICLEEEYKDLLRGA